MSERATHCDRHPIECEIIDDDGATVCGWCQEVHRLTEDAKQLRDQLHKTAVLCYGGECTIYGEVGYCVVSHGGTVNIRDPRDDMAAKAIEEGLIADKLPSGD